MLVTKLSCYKKLLLPVLKAQIETLLCDLVFQCEVIEMFSFCLPHHYVMVFLLLVFVANRRF